MKIFLVLLIAVYEASTSAGQNVIVPSHPKRQASKLPQLTFASDKSSWSSLPSSVG